MWLTIDGQKQRRVTGTDDPDKAAEMLVEWRGRQRLHFVKMPASCCLQRCGRSREAGRGDNSASLDRTCLASVCGSLVAILAEDSNAKGIQEGKAMTVTGHKTNSMYNATASKSWIRGETRSMRLPCDRI